MTDQPPRRPKGLGQGLQTLFENQVTREQEETSTLSDALSLPHEKLQTGKYQPRLNFNENALEELAQSIREKGILQPLLVRRQGETFELIAGERRLRAAQIAGLQEVPCRILDVSEAESFELALLENIQRSDLSSIEEAKGYRQLLSDYGYTQEALAQKLGKSRTHIANLLRLLTLPDTVQILVEQGLLSTGHARALVGTPDPLGLSQKIIHRGLSVRETEKLVRRQATPPSTVPPHHALLTEEEALARHLSGLTGLDVTLKTKASGNTLQFSFKTPMELDAFLEKLTQSYLSSNKPEAPENPLEEA